MSLKIKHIVVFILMLLCICQELYAQRQNDIVMANDHIILLLDINSPEATLDSLLRTAGVAGPGAKTIKSGNYSGLQKLGWNVLPMPGNLLRIDRPLPAISSGIELPVTAIPLQKSDRPGYPGEVLYGVNNFARITVRELPNGLTRFFVPGQQRAKMVMLSGNFNNWSTLLGPMLKTDSGWIKDVRLEPGVYEYKYIFDGHWAIDANNNLKRDDGEGNTNSVYYRYNFSFKLHGYTDAHRVVVAGSFNRWNAGELIMGPTTDGWELRLFLHDGIHLYRFLVDGKPVTDPANKAVNNDAAGNRNSVLSLGETVYFKLAGFANAQTVSVAGDFNQWRPNQLLMKKVGNTWVLPYTFAAGNYQYKFIVDGHWMTDPANPHHIGGETNSFLSVRPNHIFHLKGYGNAKKVILSGTFNNWSEDGYTMEHSGDEWSIALRLKPGKYLYKFIIDGNWIMDPANALWEQNAEHTGNSVLWVE